MPAKPKNADFFGTFLSSVGDHDQPAHAAELQRQLLHKLNSEGGRSSVRALLNVVPAPPSIILGALRDLDEARLIQMTSIEADEYVELTAVGRAASA